MRADMHVHTFASDGLLTVEAVLGEAQKSGVNFVVITDHDTAYNTRKLKDFQNKSGVLSVSGIEISAYEGDVKLHTLGYNFNPEHPDFSAFLKRLFEGSFRRAEEISSKLKKVGVKLSVEEMERERANGEIPLHAMHIARAAVKKGYASNPFAFYANFLAYGTPAFTNLCRPAPEEAIEVINAAGGVASLAHPGRIDLDPTSQKKLISRLSLCGLYGIEAVYSTHTNQQTAYYKEIAKEFGLEITGGSDTHHTGGSRVIGKPFFEPSPSLLRTLKL